MRRSSTTRKRKRKPSPLSRTRKKRPQTDPPKRKSKLPRNRRTKPGTKRKPPSNRTKDGKPEQINERQQPQHTEQAQPAQRTKGGGDHGGGRIPEDRYRAHFGQEHKFHCQSAGYGRDRRFPYGGHKFGFVDEWPRTSGQATGSTRKTVLCLRLMACITFAIPPILA